jgi:hypothetical protein
MPSRRSGRSVSLWMVTAHGIEPRRLADAQNADVCVVGAATAGLLTVASPRRTGHAARLRRLPTEFTLAPSNGTPWELRFLREAGRVTGPAVEPLAPAEVPELTK